MKSKKLLMLVGSVCLALVLVIPLVIACAGPAPTTPAPTTPAPTTPAPTTPPPKAEVYNWKMQCGYGWEDPSVKNMHLFINRVKEKSEGRINITQYAEGEVIPTSEVLDAVGKGVVEMGQNGLAYYAGEYSVLASTIGFPGAFVGEPHELYEKFFTSGLYDVWEEALEPANCTIIGFLNYGEYPALYGREPINSIDDFKGKRMRLNPPFDEVFAKVGAETLWIPGGEQYMALKLGTIDIGSWDCTAYRALKWYEVAPYYYRPCLIDSNTGCMWMNLEVFNSLPEDLQKVVREAGDYYTSWTIDNVRSVEMQWVTDHQQEFGYEVWTLSPEIMDVLMAKGREVLDEFAEQDDLCARAAAILKKDFME